MAAHNQFANSPKQQEIMKIVTEAAAAGEDLTVLDLKAKLSYGPGVSKSTVLCSLRFLEKHGYITKRYRGCKSALVLPTIQGMLIFKPAPIQ